MNKINRCKPLLGTYVEVSLSGDYNKADLINFSEEIFKKIEKIQKQMSFYDNESELSYINSNAFYHSCAISDEIYEVLSKVLELSVITKGAYDITVAAHLIEKGLLPNKYQKADPNASWRDIQLSKGKIKFNKRLQIDLGGIAKGFAVDKALDEVKEHKLDVIINAGGDLVMNNWQNKLVDIKLPTTKKHKVANLRMQNIALATSSSYYFDNSVNPIFCGKTRNMLVSENSASVFAPSCMLADALTKVAFLCDNSVSLLKSLGAAVVFADQDGVINY